MEDDCVHGNIAQHRRQEEISAASVTFTASDNRGALGERIADVLFDFHYGSLIDQWTLGSAVFEAIAHV
ncbi:hypothetical protein D3C72_2208780 [compost metagenome]